MVEPLAGTKPMTAESDSSVKSQEQQERRRKEGRMESWSKTRPVSLTEREREILQLVWGGLKNREIGQRLKISIKTVEAHRANIMKKLRVSNAAQLLREALEGGYVHFRRAG
ncbi:MAG: response regulator transcription factor [Nitrospirae bacterium]|nr:MAG: response regulator transcription factor [Nitrospirota bacterium]